MRIALSSSLPMKMHHDLLFKRAWIDLAENREPAGLLCECEQSRRCIAVSEKHIPLARMTIAKSPQSGNSTTLEPFIARHDKWPTRKTTSRRQFETQQWPVERQYQTGRNIRMKPFRCAGTTPEFPGKPRVGPGVRDEKTELVSSIQDAGNGVVFAGADLATDPLHEEAILPSFRQGWVTSSAKLLQVTEKLTLRQDGGLSGKQY